MVTISYGVRKPGVVISLCCVLIDVSSRRHDVGHQIEGQNKFNQNTNKKKERKRKSTIRSRHAIVETRKSNQTQFEHCEL